MTRLIGIWRSWTLLRQLVIGVSAVVMVVLVTVGATSVLSLRGSVLGIIDAQLSGFGRRLQPSGDQVPHHARRVG